MPHNVTISFDSFCDIMSDCVRVGYMQAMKAYEPAADHIKESEVISWLKAVNIDPKKFRMLVAQGYIGRSRRGASANSAWFYSKSDIVERLVAVEAHQSLLRK